MSVSDKDIEEIIAELNINDIYYLLYIASKWFERMKRAEYMLRRITSQLGVYRSSTGGEDLIKAFIREELSKALGSKGSESDEIALEESPESREKLLKVIEKIKSSEGKKQAEDNDKKE